MPPSPRRAKIQSPPPRRIKPLYAVPSMAQIASIPWNGFNVVSTFSGCGGSSLGYKMAGFKVLWANEFIPEAQVTYRANHPSTILDIRDIRTVQAEDILKAVNLNVGEIDLFDGSPPCASFSTVGIRDKGWGTVKAYSDSEQRTDDLFFEYARLIKGTQPKCFVAENVRGLTIGVAKDMLGDFQQDMFKDQSRTIVHTLMDCGYRVGFRVLNAANLGVPQIRQRVIFVGIRKDLAKEFSLEPCWPCNLPYKYSLREAIPWLSGMIYVEESNGLKSIGTGMGHPFIRKDNTQMPTIVCSPVRIIEKIEVVCAGVFGKEHWKSIDQPGGTIGASPNTGNGLSPSGVLKITDTRGETKRKFTIEELKRICSFPDDFILTGSFSQQWERLGRAVPPVMMKHIAACVRDNILKKII